MHKSVSTEFYIMHGKAVTLLGHEASKLLGVLRVGVTINRCKVKSDALQDMAKQAQPDRILALKAKFPKGFQVSSKGIN